MPIRWAPAAPVRPHGQAVRPEEIVARDRRLVEVPVARRERAVEVAAVGHHPRLVQRGPEPHPVVQRAEQHLGVVGEPAGDVRVEPAAAVVERGGQVPVVQRHRRLDAALQQAIDQPPVEVEPRLVHLAGAGGQHPGPADAEAIGGEPQTGHEVHVRPVAPVVVAGDVAVVPARGEARGMDEPLPDAGPGAVGEGRAFDLVGGGRRAPEKTVGEAGRVTHRGGGGASAWRA